MMMPPLACDQVISIIASVENTRPGVSAIRLQSRESRDPKRGRYIKVRFLDTNKVNGKRQNKVETFSAPGSETPSIPLKNPERVKGEEEAGGVEKQLGA